jgi:hypothetical protein
MHRKPLAPVIAAAVGLAAVVPAASAGETDFSGRLYFNLTHIDQTDSEAGETGKSGFGLDVKRIYLGVEHAFDETWSANLILDSQYQRDDDLDALFVKKAYLQGRFSEAAVFRAGAADMPWVPLVESYYGFRYVENTLIDRLKFGGSTDWGLHLGGEVGDGAFNYAASVVNGAGYREPDRSDAVDFEARVGFVPIGGMIVAVGGYSGKLGEDRDTVDTFHTAQRVDALVAYKTDTLRVGAEYFRASNWGNVLNPESDSADGWSLWASQQVADDVTVFARYDRANLSRDLEPAAEDTYYNAGVEYQVTKDFKLAAVYKHIDRERAAGTADLRTADLRTHEIGVWGEVRF